MARVPKLPKTLYGVIEPGSEEVITFSTKKERKQWIEEDMDWGNGKTKADYIKGQYTLVEQDEE